MSYVLTYSQTLLKKLAFDSFLFEKELKKAIQNLSEDEKPAFILWCFQNFGDVHYHILNAVCIDVNTHIEDALKYEYKKVSNNWSTIQYIAFLYFAMTIADGESDVNEQKTALECLEYLHKKTNPGIAFERLRIKKQVMDFIENKSIQDLIDEIKEISPKYSLASDIKALVLADLHKIMEVDQIIHINESRVLNVISESI